MTDTEIVELETRIDFGCLGHQPVTVVGSVHHTKLEVAPEYVEAKVISVVGFILTRDRQQTLAIDVTHLLDYTSRSDLENKIEAKFRAVKRVLDQEPIYDFPDGGAA